MLGLELGGVEADRAQNRLDRRYDRIATRSWEFSRNQYGFNSYARPALVLDTLEGMLGRETFARVMRTYHERFRFGHPTGTDFFAVAEEVSGRDLDFYFSQVVLGTGVFDPAITRLTSDRADGFRGRLDDPGKPDAPGEPRVVLEEEASRLEGEADDAETRRYWSEIELRQLGEVNLPVEVELRFEGAEPEIRIWDGALRWERWTFDRPERLLEARIDPAGKLALDANRLNNARRSYDDAATARSLSVRLLFWAQNALGWLGL
jgi:hypothetical protein